MSEQENIRLVQQTYEGYRKGDLRPLLSLLADEVEWVSPELEWVSGTGGCCGCEDVSKYFSTINEHAEIRHFEPSEFIAQGEKVVVLGHSAATARATGKKYESDWAHVFTLKDGKIVRFQQYFDTAATAAAFR